MPLQITKTTQTEWKLLLEEGVKTEGIYIKILRFDEAAKRPPTFLLKFDAGASYPNHNHRDLIFVSTYLLSHIPAFL